MDLFSTNVLVASVANLKRPSRFFLSRFFPQVLTETSEEIHFDIDEGKRRIAPFVSPLVAGKVIDSRGFVTKTFKPAYIKDKRRWNPNRPLKRAMGEAIGGNLSPQERIAMALRLDLEDQIAMVDRRLELMAIEAMRLGQVTVTGEGFPDTVVNYGRAGSLTITLVGTAQWDDPAADPVTDLENAALEVAKQSGATVIDVVMGLGSFQKARTNANFKAVLDIRRATGGPVELGPMAQQEGPVFRGTIGNLNIWTYSGWYVDDAGVEQPMFPDNEVVIGGPQIEGVQQFGAIQDEEFQYGALAYAPKSWVEKDPAVRWILMQSAPLVVPYRVNACARIITY